MDAPGDSHSAGPGIWGIPLYRLISPLPEFWNGLQQIYDSMNFRIWCDGVCYNIGKSDSLYHMCRHVLRKMLPHSCLGRIVSTTTCMTIFIGPLQSIYIANGIASLILSFPPLPLCHVTGKAQLNIRPWLPRERRGRKASRCCQRWVSPFMATSSSIID